MFVSCPTFLDLTPTGVAWVENLPSQKSLCSHGIAWEMGFVSAFWMLSSNCAMVFLPFVGASHQPFSHWWMNFVGNLRNGSGYLLCLDVYGELWNGACTARALGKWTKKRRREWPVRHRTIWSVCTMQSYTQKVKTNDKGTLHTLGRVVYFKSTIISFKRHKWIILLQICPVTPFLGIFS